MPKCEWCKEDFDAPHAMGPEPRYCRASHRMRAFEERRTLERIAGLASENKRLTKCLRKIGRLTTREIADRPWDVKAIVREALRGMAQ